MKLPKLSPKQMVLAAGVGFLVVLLVFIFLMLVPQVVKLGALRADEETAREDYSKAQTNLKQLEEIKQTSRKGETELMRAEQKVPTEAELPTLIVQVETTASKSGLTLLEMTPGTPVQMSNYQEIPVTINVQGYFYPLLDFVYRLEKLPRLFNVVMIDIKENAELKLPALDVTIKGNVYVLTPGQEPASGGPKAGAAAAAPAAEGAAK